MKYENGYEKLPELLEKHVASGEQENDAAEMIKKEAFWR